MVYLDIVPPFLFA